MSEQIVAPDKFDFTIEDVGRFLQEKWKQPFCEICLAQNTYGLNAFQSDAPSVIALPLNKAGEFLTTTPHAAQACITLFCSNCGNVKLLSANIVKKWLGQNR